MDHSEDPSASQSFVSNWVDNKLASLRPPAEWQPNLYAGEARLVRSQPAGFFRTRIALLAIAVAVAASGLLAFPHPRVLAERCVDACVAGTNGLARFVGIKATVGAFAVERRPAPAFTLTDVDGRAVNLEDLRGKVVVVNFWATWCGPCKVEIPWFMELNDRFHDRGLTVVGISMDGDGWNPVRPFLAQRGVNYPVVLGSDQLANAYGGVDALPATFLVDKTGKIAFAHAGLISKAVYEDEILRLISEEETSK